MRYSEINEKLESNDSSNEALGKALEDLCQEALKKGVNLDLIVDDNSIGVVWIERGLRAEKGTATPIMQELCAIADNYQLPLCLHAAGGMIGLVDYYRKFGFEPEHELEYDNDDDHAISYSKEEGADIEMWREPRLIF